MSKNDVIALLRESTSVECPIQIIKAQPETGQIEVVTVTMYSHRSAEIVCGALNHMRNVQAWTDDDRVLIPLDDTGYTRRYNSSLPEPQIVRY